MESNTSLTRITPYCFKQKPYNPEVHISLSKYVFSMNVMVALLCDGSCDSSQGDRLWSCDLYVCWLAATVLLHADHQYIESPTYGGR